MAELACISENSPVLTDHGLVPIEKVTTEMKVWDGREWVNHDGVVYRGERKVITYEGLTATEDHLVFVEGQSEPVQFGAAASSGAHLIQTGDGWRAIRMGENHRPGEAMEQKMEQLLCADGMPGVWRNSVADSKQPDKGNLKGMPELHAEEEDTSVAGPQAYSSKAEMRKSGRPRIPQLWGKRDKVRLSERNGSRTLFDSGIWNSGEGTGDRPDKQQRGLCTGEPALLNTDREPGKQKDHRFITVRPGILALFGNCRKKKTVTGAEPAGDNPGCGNSGVRKTEELAVHSGKVRVYDIRNAGRRHCFTVSNCLVHNCGYQGGAGALISMGALDMGLSESELPGIIESWRESNPKIVQYWWDVDKAAIDTVKDHQERTVGKIGFHYYAGALWLVLPSGRRLAYMKPRLQPNRFGRMSLTFEGTDSANKWSRGETYGGKLVENLTQAIARDILAEAMWRMEQAGLPIIAHVHDEVILEVPKGTWKVEDVCSLMAQNPAWCQDAPLNAAGYLAPSYYFKD